MCVIAVAILPSPKWRLVVATNRDEFHIWPTDALDRWDDDPHILAGRDLQSGGTWLGVSDKGRFAAISNVRGEYKAEHYDLSRGRLVSQYLSGEPLSGILDGGTAVHFGPFNLVTFDGEAVEFASNVPKLVRRPLRPGVFTLSNSLHNAQPVKTRKLQRALENWLIQPPADPMNLLEALGPNDRLDVSRNVASASYPRPDRESSIFVRDSTHGTRSSTVATVDADGRGSIIERRFDCTGESAGLRMCSFSWPGGD